MLKEKSSPKDTKSEISATPPNNDQIPSYQISAHRWNTHQYGHTESHSYDNRSCFWLPCDRNLWIYDWLWFMSFLLKVVCWAHIYCVGWLLAFLCDFSLPCNPKISIEIKLCLVRRVDGQVVEVAICLRRYESLLAGNDLQFYKWVWNLHKVQVK